MTHDELVEKVARAICEAEGLNPDEICFDGTPSRPKEEPMWRAGGYDAGARAAVAAVYEALKEPTTAQHHAARDWSAKKYGKPIGFDASKGCWPAMLAASPLNGGHNEDND